jgi:hypothetical protein
MALQGTALGKPPTILIEFMHGPDKEDREPYQVVEIMENGFYRLTDKVATGSFMSNKTITVKVTDQDGNTIEKTVAKEMTHNMYWHFVFWGTSTAIHEPAQPMPGGQSKFYTTFTVKEFPEQPHIAFVRGFAWLPNEQEPSEGCATVEQ